MGMQVLFADMMIMQNMGKEPSKTTNLCLRIPTGVYETMKAECERNNAYANMTDLVVCALREYLHTHGISKEGSGGGGLNSKSSRKKFFMYCTGLSARC